mgnify:CR=1 FL=1
MKIDEFEFQDKNGNEIEPTKNQLVIYIKSLHKQIAELQREVTNKYPFIKEHNNGLYIEYYVVFEQPDGTIATCVFSKNKDRAYEYLKSLKGGIDE